MNDTAPTNPITPKNAHKLVEELWQAIMLKGFGAWSKNDINDYLLYLFNKHDEKHFFDSNSNEQNERLLKTTAAKIKASKKNISVKFLNKAEYDEIFEEFLCAFANKRIAIKDGSKEDTIKLTIENPVFRNVLEAKLKDKVQEGFEYSLNSEKVEISCKAFITMLKDEAIRLKKSDNLNKVLQEFETTKTMKDISALLDNLSKAPQDFGVSFLKDFVPKVCKTLYTKFKKDTQ